MNWSSSELQWRFLLQDKIDSLSSNERLIYNADWRNSEFKKLSTFSSLESKNLRKSSLQLWSSHCFGMANKIDWAAFSLFTYLQTINVKHCAHVHIKLRKIDIVLPYHIKMKGNRPTLLRLEDGRESLKMAKIWEKIKFLFFQDDF